MSTLRFAQLEDIPPLIRIAKELHAQSILCSLRFDARTVWNVLENSIQRSDRCLVVAVDRTEIVGVIFALAEQHLFGPDLAVRIEVFYVVPRLRGTTLAMRMLGSLKAWSDNRNAVEISFVDRLSSSDDRRPRLFRKIGFLNGPEVYSRWL